MSDRDETRGRSEKADPGRQGFGDDQGTRVGAPTPGADRKPSAREPDPSRTPDHLSESFRVSGTEGTEREEPDEAGVGMGAEAAEGMHTTDDRDPRDRSALEDVDTGRSRPDEATVDRAGSEPIRREREHKSGYGGEGGSPKTSSDTREPLDPNGRAGAS